MNEEATETGLLPRTPETISSEESGTNSAGKAATAASLSPKDDGKILSRYLGASVGSCHDLCKYGRKHSFRSKGKHHAFPLFAASQTTPEKEQHRVKIPSLAERRKKSAVKQKASSYLKTGLYDKHVILEEASLSTPKTIEPVESKIINENTLILEKNEVSEGPEVTKCNLPSTSKEIESFSGFESIKQGAPLEETMVDDDPEMSAQEMSPPLKRTEVSGNPETSANAKTKNPFKKVNSSSCPAATEQRTKSSKNPFASLKSKIMQKVPSPVKKAISSGKSKVSNQVAPSPTKRSDASARLEISGKSKNTTLKSICPPNSTEGTTSRKFESKEVKSVDPPILGAKKTLKPQSTFMSSQPTLNRVSSITLRKVKITRSSSLKHQKKVERTEHVNEKVREKALYVIAPRSAVDKRSEAQQSRASSSSVLNHEQKYRDSDFASVSKHVRANIKKTVQSEEKKSLRKVVTKHPEDRDPTPQKIKFRRGKVVDPQFDNDGRGRLIFRQGKKLGDNQIGKSGRRSFKKRESGCGDLNHPCPEGQIVVLRHQDVPDKKETQGLFNHVIEETANKLVETRKSKVKALVGAFETVISLQERRPVPSGLSWHC